MTLLLSRCSQLAPPPSDPATQPANPERRTLPAATHLLYIGRAPGCQPHNVLLLHVVQQPVGGHHNHVARLQLEGEDCCVLSIVCVRRHAELQGAVEVVLHGWGLEVQAALADDQEA